VNNFWTKDIELTGLGATFFSLFAPEASGGDWSRLRDVWEYSHVARGLLDGELRLPRNSDHGAVLEHDHVRSKPDSIVQTLDGGASPAGALKAHRAGAFPACVEASGWAKPPKGEIPDSHGRAAASGNAQSLRCSLLQSELILL
jgi:hypothetical protein